MTGRYGSTYVSLENELLSVLSSSDPRRVAVALATEAMPAYGRQQKYSANVLAQAQYHSRYLLSRSMGFAQSYASESWRWGDSCSDLCNTKCLRRRLPALWLLRAYCFIALEHRLQLVFCIGWNSTQAPEEYRAHTASPLVHILGDGLGV